MAEKTYQIAFDDEPVGDDFYGNVVALTIEENTGVANTLHLELSIRIQDDGSWEYMDDDRLALFSKVSVKVGFTSGGGLAGALGGITGGNDGLEPVFDGYVTS